MENATVIIDTGVCNLTSVYQALIRVTDNVIVASDARTISNSARVLLPGVGAAPAGMKSLNDLHLINVIKSLQQPVLGICLGMQLLARSSTEGGVVTDCLDVISTDIIELECHEQSLPHMGWNKLLGFEQHPIFAGLDAKSFTYFVHSFCAPVSKFTIATCEYGQLFSAGIASDNFIGLQFHPEKSSTIGSKILTNFCAMR
ncbi:imidazole glycerol phosphate synthase subunit HisH [Shewanella sp. 202IG2-18]|nr:imidazole glycerol phosphate synthase subunit HisH [Parashewanella hymeniacidonis]